jgi:hypothetical protein
VSHRPLVFVFGLTVGDYLLWSWSSSGSHDVLALVSGLTLPPLAAVCAWQLALGLARLIAGAARRPSARPGTSTRPGTSARPGTKAPVAVAAAVPKDTLTSGGPSDTASRTLAA